MLNPVERVTTTMNPVRRAGRLTHQIAGASGSQPQAPTEAVDVAHTAALLAAIAEASDTILTVDQARITQLQEAVASGTLRANPQQIAQSAISLDSLLSGEAASLQLF